jgi:hypothetical protein
VPITFACLCGKTLRVKDDLAGKWVRCPACQETAIVPEADPQFEVVEDDPPAPARSRVPAELAARRREESEDDRPRRRRPADDREDEEDDRPRRRLVADRDDEDDQPRRPKKKLRPKKEEKKRDHFAMEKGVLNGGVAMGLLAMVGAVVWFVVGLMNDFLFYYPPVLFVLGLIGFIKGLVSGGRSDD